MAEAMWVYWLFFAICMRRKDSRAIAVHQCGFAAGYMLRVNAAGLVL